MTTPLQAFDYRSSPYQRPNQDWVCGWTADGCPCQIGPDAKGRCRAVAECQPVQSGERWLCTRSEFAGGRCPSGPLPDGSCCRPIQKCQPVRSWRARRRALTRAVAALTIGLLAMLLSGDLQTAFIEPGTLTFHHSEVKGCAGCHASHEGGVLAWPAAAFMQSGVVADSGRCVACHQLGQNHLLPHGMAVATLAERTEIAAPPSARGKPVALMMASATIGLPVTADGPIGCMTCHQEHRGKSADLTALSDQRCMSCHQSAFDSLSDGHPDFTFKPYNRATRLVFDHNTHIDTHFGDKAFKAQAPKDCAACHTADAKGERMVVQGFDKLCGACHQAQIAGEGRATEKGVALIAVPGLDLETLEEHEVAIGEWHEGADGEILPVVDLLLSGEAGYADARAVLAEVDDLTDLTEIEEEKLEAVLAAVKTVAWAIKGLVFDLTVEGPVAWRGRLAELTASGEMADERLAALAGRLSIDVIVTAQKTWFPNLLNEVPRHRDEEEVPLVWVNEDEDDDADEAETGGSDEGGDLLADDNQAGDSLAGDSLAGDETAAESEGLIDDDDEKIDADEDEAEALAEVVGGEDWSAVGGWYGDGFTLRYRPAGHADPLVRAWIDLSGARLGQSGGAAEAVFAQLAKPDAPGYCTKCHSVEQTAAGAAGVEVNWLGARPNLYEKSFTAFSHSAHFNLLNDKGCLRCHGRDPNTKLAESFKDRDPMTYVSNFNAVRRETCAGCHTKAVAGDGCLTCHNYHIGTFPPAMTQTSFGMAKGSGG